MRKTPHLLPRSGPSNELPEPGDAGAIGDVTRVRALLIAAARRGEPLSYSDLLDRLGHRFTRPKMRAVCRTLDAIDAAGVAAGEPELAVLVVREVDGLPGQGWWTAGPPFREGYGGAWSGPEALVFVRALQDRAFRFWSRQGVTRDAS
ncbi:hypothetical protein [Beijerinckia sp. L45]|uniref:hypothetical protein n=1 Tax=Beijerinckia sp. L45 TaxID=1641855 RepID=UPI001AEF34D6|nr:hypothetical protein [Beijerinckia sp. L45]